MNPKASARILKNLGKYPFIDLERQTGSGNLLKFWVTCPECGYERWRHKHSLAASHRKGILTGLCRSCTGKARVSTGSNNIRWKGGRRKNRAGYIEIHLSGLSEEDRDLACQMGTHGGYVLEHRLIVAKRLGRPLGRWELVRHLNGKKDDNRPENLAVGSPKDNTLDHVEAFREIAKLRKEVRNLTSVVFSLALEVSRLRDIQQEDNDMTFNQGADYLHTNCFGGEL